MGRTRRVSTLALGLVTIVALTGCTPADHISARLINGQLNVVFCDAPSYDQLRLTLSSKDTRPFKPKDIWIASGPRVQGRAQYLYGSLPSGWTTVLGPEPLSVTGNYFDVIAEVATSQGSWPEVSGGVFDGDAVSADYWLTAGGDKLDSPCK